MRKMSKLLAFLMAVMMVACSLPVFCLTASAETNLLSMDPADWTIANGSMTYTASSGEMKFSGGDAANTYSYTFATEVGTTYCATGQVNNDSNGVFTIEVGGVSTSFLQNTTGDLNLEFVATGTTATLTITKPAKNSARIYNLQVVAKSGGGTTTYTVTPGSVTGGTITLNSGSSAVDVDDGDSVALVATPDPDYTFGGWTYTGTGTFGDANAASTTLTPTSAGTVTATFNAQSTPSGDNMLKNGDFDDPSTNDPDTGWAKVAGMDTMDTSVPGQFSVVNGNESTKCLYQNVDFEKGNTYKLDLDLTVTSGTLQILLYDGSTLVSTDVTMSIDKNSSTTPSFTFTPSADATAIYLAGWKTAYTIRSAVLTDITTKYNVTIAGGIANGSVTADKATAAANATVTLTVTPETGYVLDTLTVTGESAVTTTKVNDTTYTFTMPASAVTVTALFKEKSTDVTMYTLSFGTCTYAKDKSSTADITIPDGVAGSYASGSTVTITVEYADQYNPSSTYGTFSSLNLGATKNGESLSGEISYGPVTRKNGSNYGSVFATFTFIIEEDTEVAITSKLTAKVPILSVDVSQPKLGITVVGGSANVTEASAGDTVTLTANAADSGMVFDRWVVTSNQMITITNSASADTASFTMPAGDVSIKATYKAATLPDAVKSASFSASLTLNDNIAVNFKMKNKGTEFDVNKLTVQVNGTAISGLSVDKSGVVNGVLARLQPSQIGKQLYVEVLYEGIAVKSFNYSIPKYCNAALAQYSTGTLAELCTAVLQYGKAAAIQFEKSTAAFGVTTLDSVSSIVFDETNFKPATFLAGGVITGGGASLNLGSTVDLVFTLDTTSKLTKNDVTIVNNNGQKVNPDNIGFEEKAKGGGYIVTVKNISAGKLANKYTVTIGDFSYTYGAYNYCYTVQELNKTNSTTYSDNLVTLCKAIYNYGEKAAAYKG